MQTSKNMISYLLKKLIDLIRINYANPYYRLAQAVLDVHRQSARTQTRFRANLVDTTKSGGLCSLGKPAYPIRTLTGFVHEWVCN